MESTSSKAEVLRPVILKAGVPLAVSVVGFIYAWIMARKTLSKASSSSETPPNSPEINSQEGLQCEESFHILSSMADIEEPNPMDSSMVLAGSSTTHVNPCFEQELANLRSRIENLRMKELALSLQFDRYCDLKDQESLLLEMRNVLSLENARVEFLDREISTMEAENKRLEKFMVQYLRAIEQIEHWKSETGLLQRKLKKLVRKSKAKSRLIKEQTLKIEAEQAEILRTHDALQTRTIVITKLEDEIRELQRVLDQLQNEKNELLKKVDAAEKANASKIEAGDIGKEDYNQILNDLEKLKNERADYVKELIYLRWTNACLRHELMRHHEQQQQQQQNLERDDIELELEGSAGIIHYDSEHELGDSHLEEHNIVQCFGVAHSDPASSRRKNLFKRLKRWVEGGEKERAVKPDYRNKNQNQHDDRHSLSSGIEEPQDHARRSCSSA
ncbi:hypothetical protein L6164_033774 [Bauhinia variegata]|uniref:Uncharacterized protein n=1 Tax=Bauhinia variegata TaxID=167791 RepID=A0ACB9KSX9_BAUVA|nr:hypothetical protein L6164_033774 [Bauhinia variegata]